MLEDQKLRGVLCVDTNQKYLATTDTKNQVRLWNTHTWELERVIVTGHSRKITQVEFSHDCGLLASSSLDGFVKLWDVKTGEFIKEIQFKAPVGDVCFSPDSNEIAVILRPHRNHNVCKLFVFKLDDLEFQELEISFSIHNFSDSSQIVQFSPRADVIAVLSNNEIRIVETGTMMEEHVAICWSTNVDRNKILTSRDDYYFYNFDFSKDGTELLCSTLNGIVRYSTKKIQTNPRIISNIDCEFCKFSFDGKHIVHSSKKRIEGSTSVYPVEIMDTETYEISKPILEIERPWLINPSPSESLIGIQTTHARKLNIVDLTGLTVHVLDDFETDDWVFTFSN